MENYGVDPDGPLPDDEDNDDEEVVVPLPLVLLILTSMMIWCLLWTP